MPLGDKPLIVLVRSHYGKWPERAEAVKRVADQLGVVIEEVGRAFLSATLKERAGEFEAVVFLTAVDTNAIGEARELCPGNRIILVAPLQFTRVFQDLVLVPCDSDLPGIDEDAFLKALKQVLALPVAA